LSAIESRPAASAAIVSVVMMLPLGWKSVNAARVRSALIATPTGAVTATP
jgi:hypothetical protein